MNVLARYGTIAAISSAIVAVLTYLGVRPRRSWLPPLLGFAVGVVVASLVFGVFDVLRQASPAPGPPGSAPDASSVDGAVEVEIKVPKKLAPHAHVSRETMVSGTSKGLRDEKGIWLFTRGPGEYAYHPQQAPAAVDPNGNWSSRTIVGGEGDVGKEFRIVAAVVDASAREEIVAYLARESQSGDHSGFAVIPDNGHREDLVLVARS